VSSNVTVELTREEATALLWCERTVAHAYGRDHPDDGASAAAAAKLEQVLAQQERRETVR
jgi:predicted DNA-binding transcriptional regulator YafY